MKDIEKQVLQRAVSMLVALKVDFKIICDEGEFGGLEVAKPKRTARRKNNVPRNSYMELFRKTVDGMQIGDLEQFPINLINTVENANVESFRASVCSYATSKWGKGTYVSHVSEENVELMRVG